MRTWPLAVRRTGGRTYLGVPDRLGDGRTYRDLGAPSLEEVAGDEWSRQVLAAFLPLERPWAWWTRSEVISRSGLSVASAAGHINLRDLGKPVQRQLLWSGMSLVVTGGGDRPEKQTILEWCGSDTEAREHLWTATDAAREWDPVAIVDWCRDPKRWGDPASILAQPAERILTAFDGYFFLGATDQAIGQVLMAMEELAGRWSLQIVPGDPAHAWVPAPTGRP